MYTHSKILNVSAIHVAIFRGVKYKSLDILKAKREIIKVPKPIHKCKSIIP